MICSPVPTVPSSAIVYFQIDMELFNEVPVQEVLFQDISRYPAIDYDISLVLPKNANFNEAKAKIAGLKIAELKSTNVFDVYELENETSVTVRFSFGAYDRTLSMDEVQADIKKIVAELEKCGIKARF